jgi:hypothetical protein
MQKDTTTNYSIPASFRKMENMHIVFWLIKDISWCMLWKPFGVAMVIPTLVIAVVISFRTRKIKSELAHNLAVVFWISANAYWMISEFFGFDEMPVWNGYEGKHLALIPFVTGALILLYYYVVQRPAELRKNKELTM